MLTATTIQKFIAYDDVRIESGFADTSLRAIADSMGNWRSYGIQCIYSNTLKSWTGMSPLHIGWLIDVTLDENDYVRYTGQKPEFERYLDGEL